MKRKVFLAGVVLVVVVLGLSGVMKRGHKPPAPPETGISVRTALAHTGSMASTIEVSGDIKALKSVVLSAKISGRVASVPYREGDSVRAGTAVVRQDTSDLSAQVQQAEAGLLAAQARSSQAVTSAGLSDTQTEAQIRQAKAALDAAKAHLQMVKSGARSQEVAQAENAVASAKANYDNAKLNLDRMQGLFNQGALAPAQMDLVKTQYNIASAQYDSAKQQLSLVKAGAREEEIESAKKQVDQAQEAYRMALANRAQKDLRQDDIKSGKAGVALAQATLTYARQQLANAYIRTPISGTVSKRYTEPGQMASPGAPLMEVVALDTIYFEASLSEMDVDKVKIGQPVQVTVDALPGRKFQGAMQKLLPTADLKSRHFTVRIAILNRSGELKPGMFARGSIEVAKHKDAVIVPKDALMVNGNGVSVYMIIDSVAKLRPVRVGFETREEAEILSGISAGDELVILGQDKLSDGVKIHVAD